MLSAKKAACSFFPDQADWSFVPQAKRMRAIRVWRARAARRGNRDAVIADIIATWLEATDTAIRSRESGSIAKALDFEHRADRFAANIERWQRDQCGSMR